MWQRLYSHYATVAILGMLALAALFQYGLLTDVDLQTDDDISASQARRELLNEEQILAPKSTALHQDQEQLLQKPHTPFSLSTFSSANDMFVSEHLTAITAEHPKDLVVVFVDTNYLETLGVWLDHYKQHDNSGRILCIVAVSEMAYNKAGQVLSSPATQDKLGNVGETLLVNLPGKNMKNLHNLWVVRLQMMGRIINTFPKLNILYTDADAIWLKDPAQLYHHPQHQSSNIVASRGTYPKGCPIAGEANGNAATICFGFTYFRNSPDLRELVLNIENDIGKYQYDDQIAINCVLSHLYNKSVITLEDGSFVRSFSRFLNNGVVNNIKVSLLPYHQVQRHCDDMIKVPSLRKLVDSRVDGGRKVAKNLKDVVVAHCYTKEKNGHSKMESFERYGFLIQGENSLRHSFGGNADPQLTAATSKKNIKEEAAYALALDRFWRRTKAATPEGSSIEKYYYPDLKTQHQSTNAITRETRLLNSIRIPEAGSFELSVTARALAGCHPDGYPCCVFPGDPKGSCPRKDLMCPFVTGCTGHQPDYEGDETVITSLRDPVSRSVSAFFFAPPHTTVKQGEPHTWEEFVGNVQSPRYRNVLTKMLNGAYAYDDFDESKHTVESAKARLCSIAWFALSEMPISSSMMLYETPDFRQLLPNPVAFGLPAQNAVQKEEEKTDGLRVNRDRVRAWFLASTFTSNDGASFVMEHNQQDIEVFRFAEKLFCGRLLAKIGMVQEMKHLGLGVEEIEQCANMGRNNLEQLC